MEVDGGFKAVESGLRDECGGHVRSSQDEKGLAEVEGERATVRTMWLWLKVWRTEPVYVSHILQLKSAEAVAVDATSVT